MYLMKTPVPLLIIKNKMYVYVMYGVLAMSQQSPNPSP